MANEFVKSEPIKLVESKQPEMTHVFDALRLGERKLAEELFSRFAKQALKSAIDEARTNSLVDTFAKERLVLGDEVASLAIDFTHITENRIICRLSNPSSPSVVACRLKSTVSQIANVFHNREQVFMIDALTTNIEPIDQFWSFRWKQKYAV